MDNRFDLTTDEQSLLLRWQARPNAASAYLWFCAAIFLPLTAFASYGVIKRDFVAVSIGFAGLLLFEIWRVATDLTRFRIYRSIASKIIGAACIRADANEFRPPT
jgi:hypothetical protein